MKPYEKAIDEFTKKWMKKPEVIGIIVCGSYITGNPSKHSDIDVQILLNTESTYRMRGNTIINGFLIEYFVNPISYFETYFQEDFERNAMIASHMIATGKIMYQKSSDIMKLQKKAKANLKKQFKKNNNVTTEVDKYSIWDMNDNLEEIFESGGKEFFFVMYASLYQVYQKYAKYLQEPIHQPHKVLRFLTNKTDQDKYLLTKFPDKYFVALLSELIQLKTKKDTMQLYAKLIRHVLDKMGGFEIDGWNIKSKV